MPCSCYCFRPAGMFTSITISLGLLLTSADYLGIPIRSNMYMYMDFRRRQLHFLNKKCKGPSNYDLWSFSYPLISGNSLGFLLWRINIKSYGPLILAGGCYPSGVKGQCPCRGRGGLQSPLAEKGFQFSDPFESLFLSHIIYMYYRVYLQVFICRNWDIFPCINADSWEKDVHLHIVSGTKFYKNICHIVWVYCAWRLSIYFFFFFYTLL